MKRRRRRRNEEGGGGTKAADEDAEGAKVTTKPEPASAAPPSLAALKADAVLATSHMTVEELEKAATTQKKLGYMGRRAAGVYGGGGPTPLRVELPSPD